MVYEFAQWFSCCRNLIQKPSFSLYINNIFLYELPNPGLRTALWPEFSGGAGAPIAATWLQTSANVPIMVAGIR
jgi:hypothetical protein